VKIKDVHNPWRDIWEDASFRGAKFFVETNSRQGGRRVALHEYPNRNTPYAEDMGRAAFKISVQGYCIGPYYLRMKDQLILELEKNGPGTLVLPMQYLRTDVEVMVNSYAVTESRERGGICMVEMQFVEYGDPAYREVAWSPAQMDQSARGVEAAVTGTPTATTAEEISPYIAATPESGSSEPMTPQQSSAAIANFPFSGQ